MSKLRLRVNELKPRDAVYILDEATNKYVVARVKDVSDGIVSFTDGHTINVRDPNATVEVRRLTLISGGK
jgi:hypothetical protein